MDITFNVAEMGASFSDIKSMNKVTSTIIRKIYFYKKHNYGDVYHIGIQCRNGHHRSVDIAENLSLYFSKYFSTDVHHYDLNIM
jgi:RNase adaptor protein for sRNA GlmZ degradation